MLKHTRFSALVMSVMLCLGSLQTPVWADADLVGSSSIETNAAADPTSLTTAPAAAESIGANEAADEAALASENTAEANGTVAAGAAEGTGTIADAAEAADAATAADAAATEAADEAVADTLTEVELPAEVALGDTSTSDTLTPDLDVTSPTPTPTPGGTWNDFTWKLTNSNQRLTITGSGEMPDATDAPWQTDEYRSTITEVRTGNYIHSIGANAFAGFKKLTTVKIGSRIRSIEESAFENCTKLKTINNTSTRLTDIGDRAFADCESLVDPFLPDTLITIGKEAFYSCSSIRDVIIPSKVKTLGESAFAYCAGLNSAYVSRSITTIGKYVFRGCDGPMSCHVDSYIVGDSMFLDCSGLTNVVLGAEVMGTGMYAFKNCTSLKEISIPGNVEVIGDNTFEGCLALENVFLEEGVSYICKYAFYNSGITGITLPSTVDNVGKYAFANCSELKAANLASKSLTTISEYAFSRDIRLNDVILGDELESIENNAFEHCSTLVNVNFPDKLETIGDEAFAYNYDLNTITISNSVKEIGTKAFYTCSNLETVVLGKGMETLKDQAFAFCVALRSVTVHSRTMEYAGDNIFRNSPVVMFGYYDTTSETYAKAHKITFESISSMGAPTLRVCSSVRTGVSLKWNTVEGAVNYHVYRKASGDSTMSIVKTTTGLSFLDTKTVSGTVYTYYVVADDGNVTSEPSERRTVAFVPAPGSVSVSNTLRGMQILWKSVANADKYIVYRRTATTNYEIVAKVDSSTLKYVDEHVAHGTTYIYAVAAYIEKFGSEVRNVTGAMREARECMRLTTPTISYVTTPSAGTMIVTWGKLPNVRGYKIKYSTDKYFKKDVKTVIVAGKNAYTKTLTGLESEKAYYVRVQCYQKVSRYYYSGNSYKKYVIVK